MPTQKDVIQAWAQARSGITSIWRYQNAPEPNRPYLDLNIGNVEQEGDDFEGPPDSAGKRTLYGQDKFTLSIRYFGGDAVTALKSLVRTLHQIDVRADLRLGDVIILDVGQVLDVSFLEQNHYVKRAEVEIICRTSSAIEYGAGGQETSFISIVDIQNNIDGSTITVMAAEPLNSNFFVSGEYVHRLDSDFDYVDELVEAA
jgi:hypothetical protein